MNDIQITEKFFQNKTAPIWYYWLNIVVLNSPFRSDRIFSIHMPTNFKANLRNGNLLGLISAKASSYSMMMKSACLRTLIQKNIRNLLKGIILL